MRIRVLYLALAATSLLFFALAVSARATSDVVTRAVMIFTADHYARAHGGDDYKTSVAFSYYVKYPNKARGCARFKIDQWASPDPWYKIHATVYPTPNRDTGYYDFGDYSAKNIYINYAGPKKPGKC